MGRLYELFPERQKVAAPVFWDGINMTVFAEMQRYFMNRNRRQPSAYHDLIVRGKVDELKAREDASLTLMCNESGRHQWERSPILYHAILREVVLRRLTHSRRP